MEIRKLEELKNKLLRELEIVSSKGQLTMGDLQMVDMLSHSIKNLCKVIEEMGYSGGDWRAEGSFGRYSNRGQHYVRGHYSHDGGSYNGSYRDMLENEYSNARDERERETIRRMMDRM